MLCSCAVFLVTELLVPDMRCPAQACAARVTAELVEFRARGAELLSTLSHLTSVSTQDAEPNTDSLIQAFCAHAARVRFQLASAYREHADATKVIAPLVCIYLTFRIVSTFSCGSVMLL